MRSSLVKAGVNEKEALGLAARAGNAIATLDGLFTSLAGDNQKLLTGVQGIKKSIILETSTFDYEEDSVRIKAGDSQAPKTLPLDDDNFIEWEQKCNRIRGK
mgnify:CR=1 FL=1